MSIIVTGTVALDSIESPFGKADCVLGGSATYFAYAASFLNPVHVVSIVGEDFPAEHRQSLEDKGVDLSALEVSSHPTFFWKGVYHEDMNTRDTLEVRLDILNDYQPKVPADLRATPWVFLANGAPAMQQALLDQMDSPQFVMMDTMDLWINTTRDDLLSLMKKVDALILNDEEARMLSGAKTTVAAGRHLLDMGPETVCVKKGEHGALLFQGDKVFGVPAFPLERVNDPTGAGDCFAGGFFGALAKKQSKEWSVMTEALVPATVAASFCVEEFSIHRLLKTTDDEFNQRCQAFRQMITLGGS